MSLTNKLLPHEQDALEQQLAKTEGLHGPLWNQSVLHGIVDPPNIRQYYKATLAFKTNDPDTQRLKERAMKLASVDDSVLITGESGTGKELIATIVHGERKGNFVAINMCAVVDTLFESELFGHARGAFTGAEKERIGLIEQANDGTLFLDEIGDLSVMMQAKLLRVIETRQFRKVGSNIAQKLSCRIVAATHRNLLEMVRDKTFRLDLYERLNVFRLRLKPLRERLCDLEIHAGKEFTLQLKERFGTDIKWSGNIRQVLNIKRRFDIFGIEDIQPEDLQ